MHPVLRPARLAAAALRTLCLVLESCLANTMPLMQHLHNLDCPCRLLPGLQSLLLDHSRLTIEPQALKECGALTQLTQLHLGGPACFQLRSHHLQWVGKLTRLQDLKVRGCTKVRHAMLWAVLTGAAAAYGGPLAKCLVGWRVTRS
jgi:hypothetical protein